MHRHTCTALFCRRYFACHQSSIRYLSRGPSSRGKSLFLYGLQFAPDFSGLNVLSFTGQGVNGQKKFQIHLKSSTGPIEVLLVNKDTSNSPPVVVPVPPPEDLVQPPPAVTGMSAPTPPGPQEETESRTLTPAEPSSPARE